MSGVQLLISFFLVSIGWQIVAQTLGPVLAKRFYLSKVRNFQTTGLSFQSEAAMKEWAKLTAADSMNMSLLLLAAGCGALAGLLNFPLIGFSRSANGWSWLRIITLCGVSWLVAVMFHSSSY